MEIDKLIACIKMHKSSSAMAMHFINVNLRLLELSPERQLAHPPRPTRTDIRPIPPSPLLLQLRNRRRCCPMAAQSTLQSSRTQSKSGWSVWIRRKRWKTRVAVRSHKGNINMMAVDPHGRWNVLQTEFTLKQSHHHHNIILSIPWSAIGRYYVTYQIQSFDSSSCSLQRPTPSLLSLSLALQVDAVVRH